MDVECCQIPLNYNQIMCQDIIRYLPEKNSTCCSGKKSHVLLLGVKINHVNEYDITQLFAFDQTRLYIWSAKVWSNWAMVIFAHNNFMMTSGLGKELMWVVR